MEEVQRCKLLSELAEQLRHRPTIVNPADRAGEEFGDGEDGHVGQALLLTEGDGVGEHDFFDGGVAETFDGGTGENAVGGTAVDVTSAMLVYHTHRLGE